MNKDRRKYSLILIIVFLIMTIGIRLLAIESIELQEISTDKILKGYETNLINEKVAISINGKGFKEGDKIYFNNQEVRTAIGDSTFLSFLIGKELYENELEGTVELKRFTPKENFLASSNVRKIKIIEPEERLNAELVIDTIVPEAIVERQDSDLIDEKVPLGVTGTGFTADDIIYINGEPQHTAFGNSELLTCLVPRRFYNKPSQIQVQIKTIKDLGNNHIVEVSNEHEIMVRENPEINNIWRDNIFVAHAMGSIEGKAYTNTYEAFINNYKKGTRIFEVDFIFTKDNHLVARHDWSDGLLKSFQQDENLRGIMDVEEFSNQLVNERFTPLTLEDVFALMKEYPDIYIVTDTKEIEELKIRNQFNYIYKVAKEVDENVLKRIIPQIYSPEMFEIINNIYPWENIIYKLYQSYQTQDEILEFLEKNEISAVAMPEVSASQEFIDKLLEKNIYIYIHTINDEEAVKEYLDMGVWGVYTDSLATEDNSFKF